MDDIRVGDTSSGDSPGLNNPKEQNSFDSPPMASGNNETFDNNLGVSTNTEPLGSSDWPGSNPNSGLDTTPPPGMINPAMDPVVTPPATQTFTNPVVEQVNNQPVKRPSKLPKILLMIVLILLLSSGAAVAGYFYGLEQGKTKGRQQAEASVSQEVENKEEQNTETTVDTKLALGSLVDPIYKDETINGKVTEQLTSADGFVMKVTSVERNVTVNDANYKLDSSKELVKVNLTMGNVAKDRSKDVSNFNFRIEDSSGAKLSPENIASFDGKFDTIKLDPGAQAQGSIIFAVKKNDEPLKVVREQRYRITSENREVTMLIVVTTEKAD